MALEAVVYQQQDLFSQNNNPNNDGKFGLLYPLLLENCVSSSCSSSFDYLLEHQSSSDHQFIDDWNYNYNNNLNYDTNYNYNYDYDCNYPPSVVNNAAAIDDYQQWRPEQNSSSPEMEDSGDGDGGIPPPAVVERPKRRRRVRTKKNEEEIENQRMTHIAVERNRRKQMNDYLSALRSLMPNSYVQRGDQASIIGGAINFVKELEQNLQCLSAKKQANENSNNTCGSNSSSSSLPFGEFFSFPQYSGTTSGGGSDDLSATSHRVGGGGVVADVEVTMVESHALLKIRTKRPLKQLSKLVTGLQGLRLCILHLNVSKVDGVAFYSFSLKVEDDESKLSSVDEIAGAVYQLLGRIQEEASIYF